MTLPVVVDDLGLTDEEQQIYNLLNSAEGKSIGQLMPYVKFGKSKVTKILQKMEKEVIVKYVVKEEEQNITYRRKNSLSKTLCFLLNK